jgi:hypothetical protein
MKYEVGREIFKQRLEDRMNFVMINTQTHPTQFFENIDHCPFNGDFVQKISTKVPLKTQNILLFTLEAQDQSAAEAASALQKAGYKFVYYYQGSDQDVVLDKGLN